MHPSRDDATHKRLHHGWVAPRGVRLHYVEAGEGPLIVCLHGFPDFWFAWRHQIQPLAGAGFHVVVPDLRGYNLSDKPRGVRPYTLPTLAGEIEGLIGAFATDSATIIGHDWGGAIGWWLAMQRSPRLAALIVVNTPHPVRFARGFLAPSQWMHSSYMLLFQLAYLPEAVLRARHFALLRRLHQTRPGSRADLADGDMRRYLEAWARPGALTSMLNYYRALKHLNLIELLGNHRPIERPVLEIWGQSDRFARPELADPGAALAPTTRVERIAEASHWVHLDQPERVNTLILDFLQSSVITPPVRPNSASSA
jgi:epoxide hydrolase 4